MLRKLSVLISLFSFLSITAFAQDGAPKPDERPSAGRAYSLAFGGGSYLGVQIKEVTKENYSSLGLSEVRGVSVEKVFETSPAETAGIKAGDVIIGFNGESVTSSRKLTRLISEVAPDHTVVLKVIRGGSEITLPATIGKRESPGLMSGTFVFPKAPDAPRPPISPMPPDAPDFDVAPLPDVRIFTPDGSGGNFIWSFGQRRTIGVAIEPLTKQLGDYFGVADGKGVLITNVEKDSPAERAGLKAGDVVIEANGKSVAGSAELVKEINAEKEGNVSLTVLRDKKRRTISVTPEASKAPDMLYRRLLEQGGVQGLAPKGTLRVGPAPEGRIRPLIVQPGTRVLK